MFPPRFRERRTSAAILLPSRQPPSLPHLFSSSSAPSRHPLPVSPSPASRGGTQLELVSLLPYRSRASPWLEGAEASAPAVAQPRKKLVVVIIGRSARLFYSR